MGCQAGARFQTPLALIPPHPEVWMPSVPMPPLSRFKRIDVRPLLQRGIEPLPEILKRVQELKPEQGLIVIAPFLPSPLIELLGSQGFASRVEPGRHGRWIVYFWRETD